MVVGLLGVGLELRGVPHRFRERRAPVEGAAVRVEVADVAVLCDGREDVELLRPPPTCTPLDRLLTIPCDRLHPDPPLPGPPLGEQVEGMLQITRGESEGPR